MFNKDVVVPGRMRRRIANPRIMLLDCPLEYKKGESQTNVEITKEEDWWVEYDQGVVMSVIYILYVYMAKVHITQGVYIYVSYKLWASVQVSQIGWGFVESRAVVNIVAWNDPSCRAQQGEGASVAVAGLAGSQFFDTFSPSHPTPPSPGCPDEDLFKSS